MGSEEPLILLDSGAYTAKTKGVKIELSDYAEFVRQYKHLFTGAINLDVIGDGKASYQNWKELQRQGIDTIPVYHIGTDETWLERYLKQTDYLAIGAIANLDTKKRLAGLSYIWRKYLLDNQGKPKLKVHGLGLTSLKITVGYPWYSVDSATATKSAGYGAVIVPKLTNIRVVDDKIVYDCDLKAAGAMTISHWRNRVVAKTVIKFHALPPNIKHAYEKYFSDRGYHVGSIAGTTRPLTRREKRELAKLGGTAKRLEPIFSIAKESNGKAPTTPSLMESYTQRVSCSLDFWVEFGKAFQTPIVYQVVSNVDHLSLVAQKNVPFLASYFTLNQRTGLFKALLEWRGGNEGQ